MNVVLGGGPRAKVIDASVCRVSESCATLWSFEVDVMLWDYRECTVYTFWR
jgi:hypothetical protein